MIPTRFSEPHRARSPRLARTALCCGLLGALLTSGGLSAQEPAGAPLLDTVVVTGSHIRGAVPVGHALTVISREMIERSGKLTAGDLLRELPSNFAGGVGLRDNVQGGQDASVAGSNMTGGQGVNLRGLGALSTLVLVNGRRVAAAGQYGDFVDISSIPANAIAQIEVLLDGASAIYGSDAVGGVVNFILKRSDDGAQTSAQIGTTTQGGGSQTQLGQSWGTRWDGGGLIAGYEFNGQNRVLATERAIYNGHDFSNRGGINWRQRTGRAGSAANLFQGNAAGNGNVIWRVPGGAGIGLTANDLIAVDNGIGNTYNAWEMVDIIPEMDRHSGFFSIEHSAGATMSLYGDLRYSRRRGTYTQGYQALYGALGPDNPHFIPGVANNYGVLIDDRPLQRDVEADSLAANLGAIFTLGERWNGEINASWSREEQRRNSDVQRNANIYDDLPGPGNRRVQAPTSIQCSQGLPANASPAAQAYCASLNYTAFNPWTTGPLPAAVVDQLIGYEDLRFTSTLAQASFKLDGDVFSMPGGSAKLATGLDYRREQIGGELDFNWRSIQNQHEAFGTTKRNVSSLFTELALPLIGRNNQRRFAQQFDVSLAARYERGNGLGDFSTFNQKIGIHFKPTDGLALRGSWGTSFHAPPMRYAYNGVQPISGGNGAFMRADLYNAPCNTTLVPLNGVNGTPGGAGNCTFTAIVVSGGAGPTLRPEEATTWSAGFDWSPDHIPGLRVGASYFNLKIDDRIVRIQAGQLGGILAQLFATGTTPYLGSLEINPLTARVQDLIDNDPRYLGQLGTGPAQSTADVAMIVNATQLNMASLKMDGIDFNLGFNHEVGAGELEWFARSTWLRSYKVKATPESGYVDQLGKYSAISNPVQFRSQQGIHWQRGLMGASLSMNYVNSYECASGCLRPNAAGAPAPITSPVKISSWTTFDLGLHFDSMASGPFKDVRVNFMALNVTDRDPPFIDGGTAANDTLADPYDPANAIVLGRTLVLSFDRRW